MREEGMEDEAEKERWSILKRKKRNGGKGAVRS